MKSNLCSLCVNLFFMLILDSVALKLVPGDRSVVKKDGATHTISKYYVVPNDFELNKDANDSGNNNRYAKRMNQNIAVESEAQIDNGKKDEHLLQANLSENSSVNKKWASGERVNTKVTSEPGPASQFLGNLKVESNTNLHNSVNISNENNLHNATQNVYNENAFVKNKTELIDYEKTMKDFAYVILKSSDQNLDSFLGVYQNYVTLVDDPDEKKIRMEKLLLLLNIFTKLYRSTQLNLPIDDVIDDIVHILRTGHVKNTDGSLIKFMKNKDTAENNDTLPKQVQTRKCQRKTSKDHLDSKNVSISETDGRDDSGDLELENDNLNTQLQRRHADNVNILLKIPSHGSGTSYVKGNQPVIIQKSLLINPNKFETERKMKGKPDGFNVRFGISAPDSKHIARENDNIKLNFKNEDTVEINKLNSAAEDKMINDLLLTAEEKQINNLQNTVDDKVNNNRQYSIEDRVSNNMQYTIEDKLNNNQLTIEDRLKNNQVTIDERLKSNEVTIDERLKSNQITIDERLNSDQLTIEDILKNNQVITEDSVGNTLPFSVNDNKVVPVSIHSFEDSESQNIFIDSNQIPLNKVVSVKSMLGDKPYQLYIINPTKILYSTPEISSNIVKLNSGKYSNNLDRFLKNTYENTNSKVVFPNEPSYYESELSLSQEPNIVLNSEPRYYESQLKIKKHVDLPVYDQKFKSNPPFYLPNMASNYRESKFKEELNEETDINPTVLLSNTQSYESDVKVKQEILNNDSEILLSNVPTTLNVDNERNEVSTAGYDTKTNISPLILPLYGYAPTNDYESEIKINYDKETKTGHSILLPNTPSQESQYIKLEKDYNLSVSGNGEETDINAEILLSNKPNSQNLQFIKKPHIITYLQKNRQPRYNYVQQFKSELPPSYRLFSLENLQKLNDALRRKQVNGLNIYENRSLSNLRKINIILLQLARHLGGNLANNRWYESIFYNVKREQEHPLEDYVYNLLRQKWLHELMLLLHKNQFNLNILNSPRIYSFLGTWRFPNYVLKFLETQDILQKEYQRLSVLEESSREQNIPIKQGDITTMFGDKFGTHEVVESYTNGNSIDKFRLPHEGLILSIRGINPGLDANAVIDILKKYLLYKHYIENQQNIIKRGNKIEMFKQIVLFLRAKGYESEVIIDLIRKLYGAVYLVEGKSCNHAQHNNFVKNIYDVIVPVLRRSGQ